MFFNYFFRSFARGTFNLRRSTKNPAKSPYGKLCPLGLTAKSRAASETKEPTTGASIQLKFSIGHFNSILMMFEYLLLYDNRGLSEKDINRSFAM